MKDLVLKILADSSKVISESASLAGQIVEAARTVTDSFSRGGRLYLFGSGGSAADAQHVASEFINRFLIERPPLPAMALSADASVLTSISDDYGYAEIFSKQLKALGRAGDVAWGFTASDSSPGIAAAMNVARNLGMKTICMTGAGGGDIRHQADLLLDVRSSSPPRIQEAHIAMAHAICELVDYFLFQMPGEEAGF